MGVHDINICGGNQWESSEKQHKIIQSRWTRWHSMTNKENRWTSMTNQWNPTQINELRCKSMKINENRCNSNESKLKVIKRRFEIDGNWLKQWKSIKNIEHLWKYIKILKPVKKWKSMNNNAISITFNENNENRRRSMTNSWKS